ncbi:choice-of-anchor K domain-containing protein [Kibdelosporangium lantanae]|uniref:Choice-of-anchor K domain-containing protein n=1 Tax=Kibdelosporangium lantanae TaxID=1497396 RepID=A0ABW3M6W4_9PSEU
MGTGDVRWGDVPYDRKSGYSFDGGETELKLDGTDFTIGTFTHHNHVIPLSEDMTFLLHLTVILNFDDGNLQHPLPELVFGHDETLNDGLTPNDVVELPKVNDYDVLFVENVEYRMSISGFLWNRRKVTRFNSKENESTSAEIVARMEPTGRRGA